jgi:26S proteasome regulatory subunit N9
VGLIDQLSTKLDKDETRPAFVQAVMEAAHYRLMLGDVDGCHDAMLKSEKEIEALEIAASGNAGMHTEIRASFYRVSANYYKGKAEYAAYYKHALLYLSCVQGDSLSRDEKLLRAHDLSIAALLSDSIYNFGELLMHPILGELAGTENAWLHPLLLAFNRGDVGKFESLAVQFPKHPLLEANMAFLREKICLMALLELVFKRPQNARRRLAFSVLAAETKLPVDEVEHLVMKALALGLVKGSIDQVDGLVMITWMQGRYLDKGQIAAVRDHMLQWEDKVNSAQRLMKDGSGVVA